MGDQQRDISDFHDDIVRWRAAGMVWRAIADELRAKGLDVDHSAVHRYAQEKGIPTARVKKPKSPQGASSTVVPVALDTPPAASFELKSVSLSEVVSWAGPAVVGATPPIVPTEAARYQSPQVDEAESSDVVTKDFGKAASAPMFTPLPEGEWSPDETIVQFGSEDRWTLQDSFEGTLITGATGSGKTSGSGQLLAGAFLVTGYGGLVLTAKEDERRLWERYAERTGRKDQLCIVRPSGPFAFNFLDYQSRLPEDRGGSTENVVELFHSVLEAFSRTKRTADSFWSNAAKQLLRNLVRVIRASGEPFNVRTLRQFIVEMPRTPQDAEAGHWRATPTFGRLIATAMRRAKGVPGVDLEEAIRYWTVDFPGLWHETRSIITADFAALVDLLFEPSIWALLCEKTTITPEAVFDGAVIIVDLPIKKHHATGRLVQLIWKHLYQQAVERRNDAMGHRRRPVFLWVDEAQYFAAESDGLFQATARSSRCATVYLTQTLPGFLTAMGGDHVRERCDSLLANLTTKVFHANGDPSTNEWAATQIGRSMQYRASITSNNSSPPAKLGLLEMFSYLASGPQRSVSTAPVMDFEVQPSEFAKLRTGSVKNAGLVDAFLLKSGSQFANGKHYFRATFQQEAT